MTTIKTPKKGDALSLSTTDGERLVFTAVLKRLRVAAGFGVRRLAQRAGVLPSSVSHYENGRQVPKPEALKRIAQALSVPPELLMWFAYTERRHEGAERDLFRRVENIMVRQLRLFERALAGRVRPPVRPTAVPRRG